MKNLSELTYKVTAYSEITGFNTDDCVDWATEMLESGNESPSLLILSGISKPTNYFEVIGYLKKSFGELGLTFKTGTEGIICYLNYLIIEISNRKNIREDLGKITDLSIAEEFEKDFKDFQLISWAWGDFDFGNKFQEYWPEATPETIEDIAVNLAKSWLSENKITLEKTKL